MPLYIPLAILHAKQTGHGSDFRLPRLIQAVIRKHRPTTTPPPPPPGAAPIPKAAYGTVNFGLEASLFENLRHFNTTVLAAPQNMEALGQGYGYILYAASPPEVSGQAPLLAAPGLADRGLVYLGSELQGVIGSWVPAHSLRLSAAAGEKAVLRVLVSNEGRQSGELVSLSKNSKGILGGSTQPVALTMSGNESFPCPLFVLSG